jgi:hypothetical protein
MKIPRQLTYNMIHADPLHYYLTQGSRNSSYKKKCRGQKCLVEPVSLQTLLHHQVHIFMEHGVDPLVEIGGQQVVEFRFADLECLAIAKL